MAVDPQVRAEALSNYSQVARSVGLDPVKLMRQVGLSSEPANNPDRPLPGKAVARLLENSARQANCPGFGLMVAESRSFETIGAVGLLAKQLPTARDILRALIDYQALIAEALIMKLEERDGEGLFSLELMVGTTAIQGSDLALAFLYRALRTLTEGRWAPTLVHFAYKEPDSPAVHRRIFDCDLAFGSPISGFSMSASALDAVNPNADEIMALHARRYLDGLIAAQGERGTYTDRVTRALHHLLPEGRGSLRQVSKALFRSPRALQRALDAEGQSFARILTAVRRERALRYIDDPGQSMTGIAALTGFASQSAFTRWFGIEFGVSPLAWRAGARPSGDPVRS